MVRCKRNKNEKKQRNISLPLDDLSLRRINWKKLEMVSFVSLLGSVLQTQRQRRTIYLSLHYTKGTDVTVSILGGSERKIVKRMHAYSMDMDFATCGLASLRNLNDVGALIFQNSCNCLLTSSCFVFISKTFEKDNPLRVIIPRSRGFCHSGLAYPLCSKKKNWNEKNEKKKETK